jgi:hypothetical protein
MMPIAIRTRAHDGADTIIHRHSIGGGEKREKSRGEFEALHAKVEEKLCTFLTSEQQKQLDALQG